MTEAEKKILTQLQRGIEITSRPFQGLPALSGVEGDLPEAEVLALLQRAQADGLLRRFGGIFDARRLGYKSILCALDVPVDRMAEQAAIIAALPGVTHCYERTPFCGEGKYPRLWFTLAMLHDEFEAGLIQLREQLAPSELFELPALKRFKIDVVFDLHKVERGETFPGRASPPVR